MIDERKMKNPCNEMDLPTLLLKPVTFRFAGRWECHADQPLVIHMSPWFWTDAERDELREWCGQNGCIYVSSSQIVLPDEDARVLFSLRWS